MVTSRGGCPPALSHHPPPLALPLTRSLTGSSQRSSLFAHLSSTPTPAHAARGGHDRAERSSPRSPSSYSGAAVPPPPCGTCPGKLWGSASPLRDGRSPRLLLCRRHGVLSPSGNRSSVLCPRPRSGQSVGIFSEAH